MTPIPTNPQFEPVPLLFMPRESCPSNYSQGEEQLPIKPPQPSDSIARYHPLRKHQALFLALFVALVLLSEPANNATFIMHSTTLISFVALLLFAAVTFANPVAAPRPLERKALKQFQYKRGATPVRRSPQWGGKPSKAPGV
ncbi:hypothetical protein NLI96_g9363 [Meripilus lineatus]|uniref:Transmembrane protein n=1 Tax=Meripilus lineatus TaxID=2056292 RepID=A0AAD5UVV2_9APHY|nr:hypothetical protein NLI96_g9363 [Physisporinus lineatus]